MKVLHSINQQIWKTQQWPQVWNRSVFIPVPKKGNAKECSNYCTLALISHTSKVILKSLQARLQQYVNHELPDVQAEFRKDLKNTQMNYTKKILMTQITTMSHNVTHLEPDILECEVKWASGRITMNKVSRGDGIQAELFRILKDDSVKGLHSTC